MSVYRCWDEMSSSEATAVEVVAGGIGHAAEQYAEQIGDQEGGLEVIVEDRQGNRFEVTVDCDWSVDYYASEPVPISTNPGSPST